MQKLLLQLLVCFTLSVCLISCDKDDDGTDGNGGGGDSFSAKVSGTDFNRSGTDAYALDNEDNFQILGTTLGIETGTATSEIMYFIFDDVSGAVAVKSGDTYTFNEGSIETLKAYYVDESGVTYTSFTDEKGTGTVEITKFDDSNVGGTFSMTLVNDAGETVEITDGSFEVDWSVF